MSPTPEQEKRERDSAEQAGRPPVKPIEIAREEEDGAPKPSHFQPATQEKRRSP